MDVSGCGFLEADQKAAGFVLTCTPAGATPARPQGRLCDSAAVAPLGRHSLRSVGLEARLAWCPRRPGRVRAGPFDLQARPSPPRTW
eukprot:scaffold3226_cov63-Phaeocystis_antarctica.AAC.1